MNIGNQNQIFKVNLCFIIISNEKIMMSININEAVNSALTIFLKRCNLDYLIWKADKELIFFY